MQRRFVLMIAVLSLLACTRARAADIYGCYNGSSEQGGNFVTVNGIQSSQYVQQSFISATTTVYIHGTLSLATIYTDGTGATQLANPFTSTTHGLAFFCAANGTYDVQYSNAGIVTPFTLTGIQICLNCSGGGGGGGGTPGLPNLAVQFGVAGVFTGSSLFTFNPTTFALGLPDGSTWSPTGIVPPAPTSNSDLSVDSSAAENHLFRIADANNTGSVCTAGFAGFFNSEICIDGPNATNTGAHILTSDATHFWSNHVYPYASATDSLGYIYVHGLSQWFGDLGWEMALDRTTKSLHLFGPINLPNGVGGNSFGTLGGVIVSQGSALPPIYSTDLTTVFTIFGKYGTCPGNPTGIQNGFCAGPGNNMQAWDANISNNWQNIALQNNLPAAGITGSIQSGQINTGSGAGGLAAIFQVLSCCSQYNVPELNGSGGLTTGPFNDSAASVVSATKPLSVDTFPLARTIPNCAATGTTVNKLVKLSSSAGASCAVISGTGDTQGFVGVCVSGCGTTGKAVVAFRGQNPLVISNGTTVNDWIINSSGTGGDGQDSTSAVCPATGAQVIGRVLSTNGGAGTYVVDFGGCDTTGGGGGGLADPGGNGILSRTALNTTVNRTLTGTAGDVVVTNGDGTGGNPTFDIGTSVATLTGAQTLTTKVIDTASNTFKLNGTTVVSKSDIVNVNTITTLTATSSGGTAQAQTAIFSPVTSSLATGVVELFTPANANTAAAPTYAPDGLTAKTVTKCGTTALVAGDLTTTAQAVVSYDGTQWELQNPQAIPCGPQSASAATGWQINPGGGLGMGAVTLNTTKLWTEFYPPVGTVSHIGFSVNAADNSGNLYDFGLYNSAGNLVCHTGAIAGSSLPSPGGTGSKGVALTASCVIVGGRYQFAYTGNAATLTLNGDGSTGLPQCNVNPATNSSTSGGALNSSITYSADSFTGCTAPAITFY